MKKTTFILLSLFLIGFCFSCKSTDVNPEQQEDEVIDVTDSEDFSDEVEFLDEPTEEDEEYLRSIEKIETAETVTKSEFETDKAQILKIISSMADIMNSKNVKAWLPYIDPASVEYYSNIANLRKAQKKLPDKRIVLKDIGDYFENVFIPARRRSQVDEIRYISKSNVKAVQVREDFSTVVYYYFKKIDGIWYVHIPPVS